MAHYSKKKGRKIEAIFSFTTSSSLPATPFSISSLRQRGVLFCFLELYLSRAVFAAACCLFFHPLPFHALTHTHTPVHQHLGAVLKCIRSI